MSSIEVLCGLEVREVLVVGEDDDWVWRANEVVSPFLKCLYHGQKFSVVNFIVPFCFIECLGQIGAWVPIAVCVLWS